MTLHLIADDLRDHSWYEQVFVETIADVEAYAARWAAFEDIVLAVAQASAARNLLTCPSPDRGTDTDSRSAGRTAP
jgi:hypothetical protein